MICGGSGLFRNAAPFYPTIFGFQIMWDKYQISGISVGKLGRLHSPPPIVGSHAFGARSATRARR